MIRVTTPTHFSRLASCRAFLCWIFAHLLWPAMLIPFVFSRVEAEFASFVRRAFYHKLPLAKIFRRPEYLQKQAV